MKINGEFVLREIAGDTVVIPVGKTVIRMNGMITLDPVAATIWKALEKECSQENILKQIVEEYEVDEKTADQDLESFLKQMEEAGLLNK